MDTSPVIGKRKAVYNRWKKLENDRSSWRSHWIEISDYLLPRRGRYLLESQNSRGRKRSSKIIDNSPGQALRVLSAGMVSGLTSPARPWFRLFIGDDDIMEQAGVKHWLGLSERTLRRLLSASNFYTTAATVYAELGAFGSMAILRKRHPQKLVHYRPYTAGEYVFAENQYHEVDTLGRYFQMTVAQVYEAFVQSPNGDDWSKVSHAVRRLYERHSFDALVPVVHMIQPRRQAERDLSRIDGKNRPWADVYFEEGADNDDVLLKEDGYSRKPFFAARWDVLGGDVYGTSPGMDHLGDIKQLQHQQRRKAQALDKLVNPPMVASNSLKGKPSTVLPGGTTYVDPAQGSSGFQPAYLVQPRLAEMQADIQEVQQRIQRGFYADLFAMMINSDRRQITATEVVERHEEKLVLLGPVLQRLNTEFLDPLIEDLFLLAYESGLLPPAPEALQGQEIEVRYVSLLAQAQEAVAAAGIERTFALAGNLSAVFPSITDNIDEDTAFREYSEILGNPPEFLRDMGDVKKLREKRAEQMRQQQQLEQESIAAQTAQHGAQAAKVLSEADTQRPNALTALLQRGASAA
jgi:hypothetical protein